MNYALSLRARAELELRRRNSKSVIPTKTHSSFADFKHAVYKNYEDAPHLQLIDRELSAVVKYAETRGTEGNGYLIINMPPRHGKCIVKGSLVTLANGKRKPIEEICHSDMVKSLSLCYNSTVSKVTGTHVNGVRPVLRITALSGRYIECTENHPLLTINGWVDAENLNIGDALAVYRKIDIIEGVSLPTGHASLLGYVVGDGSFSAGRALGFTCADDGVMKHIQGVLSEYGWIAKRRDSKSGYDYSLINPINKGRKLGDSPAGLVKQYMPRGNAYTKRVPDAIYTASEKDILEFLAAYFNCDGTVTTQREGVSEFYSVNENLLRDVQYLLSRFGIYSSLRVKNGKYKGEVHHSWRLSVSGSDLTLMAGLIPVIGIKGEKLRAAADNIRENSHYPEYDAIPNGWQVFLKIGKGTLRTHYGIRVDKQYKRGTARHIVRAIANIDDNNELRKLCSPDIIWERITDIQKVGDKPTFDIEVEDTHNYCVDGIVSHNTVTVSKLFPAWFLAEHPDMRVILASYGMTLAQKNSRYARNTIQSIGFKDIYPYISLAQDSKAVDAWDLRGHEGGMDAVGVGGGVTGKGGHIIIVDDPIKSREEAESETYREKVWDWFRDDLYTRREPGGAIVIIVTRWHQDDLVGRLLRDDASKWRVLNLAAIAEANDTIGREVGAALWPERFPIDVLLDIRKTLGEYSFSALYQQKPVPAEGGIFKRAWLNAVQTLPEIVHSVRYWDTAMSSRTTADYTVGVKLGQGVDGHYYVMDVARFQKEWGDVVPAIAEVILKDGVTVQQGIEEVAFMSRAITELNQDYRLHNFSIFGYAVDKDKVTRALPFAARASAGNVSVLNSHWTDEYLDEMCSFPNGAHDDQVDASSGAWAMIGSGMVDGALNYANEDTFSGSY